LFRLYALVEAGIGLYALAFPWLFQLGQTISFAIPHSAAGAGFAFDVLLVALLVGPPTVLMGGTIPILTQALSTNLDDATRFHALVYGSNTAGAFAGAVVGTFVLVPVLGLHDTMRWMAAFNISAAIAFALFEFAPGRGAPVNEPTGEPPPARAYATLALVGLLTGFAMMVVQSVSIRLGGLVLGSSEYTFGMVVAVFVLCIAIGSLIVSLFPRIPPKALMINQCGLLGYTVFLYFTVESLPVWALFLRGRFGSAEADFLPFQIGCFLATSVLLGPTAILSGATLPLLFHNLRGRIGDLGSVAGALYSWNTAGSFLGALLGGYALLFFLDLDQVFRVALAALAAGAGLLAWQLQSGRRTVWIAGLVCAALFAVALLPPWDPNVLTHGLFRQRGLQVETISELEEAVAQLVEQKSDVVIFHEDDPIASVTVREQLREGVVSRAIITNGKPDGETGTDYPTMALAGLIPSTLIPDVKRAFVIGFGTGVTVGELAALQGMEEVVVAEISPSVLEAAPLFDFANLAASQQPNVRMVRSDAYRAFVRSKGSYDVIVSEPSNPWTTGIEMLYSQEFLRAARGRLSPGGIYVQWFHQYETDAESVALVLRTFASVFDGVAVWYGLGADFLLLGMQDSDFVPDLQAMHRRAMREDIRAGLLRSGVDSFAALLAHELVPVGVISAGDSSGTIHTLFRPLLNHVAGRAFFRGASGALPPLDSGEAARVGTQNSVLRRYLAGLPEESTAQARLEATEEACRYRRKQCLALLADAITQGPESPELAALLERVYEANSWIRVGGPVTRQLMASVMQIATPDNVERAPTVPLAAAERATRLYRQLFNYAAPFDPAVHIEFWRRCRAPAEQGDRCKIGLREAISLDWREIRAAP